MPIQQSYVTPNTGATASYHVVASVFIDYVNQNTFAAINSFVDKANHDSGKQPLYSQQIQLSGIPAAGTDPLASVQQALVAAEPTDGTASNAQNRYIFAGGTLVDMPA